MSIWMGSDILRRVGCHPLASSTGSILLDNKGFKDQSCRRHGDRFYWRPRLPGTQQYEDLPCVLCVFVVSFGCWDVLVICSTESSRQGRFFIGGPCSILFVSIGLFIFGGPIKTHTFQRMNSNWINFAHKAGRIILLSVKGWIINVGWPASFSME